MSHSDQNRYAAALYSELHQPHAIGKREMQELARVFSRLPPERILAMATTCGAKALNLPDKLGRIAADAWADLIAVPLDDDNVDPYEAVVFAEKPVTFSMIGGKELVQ